MKKLLTIAFGAALLSLGAQAQEKTPMVGGAPMYANKTIVENASNSKVHTTLVAAVKAADLVETLSSAGPFTVFAPTNEAFEKLPKGLVPTLLKPENNAMLKAILTYHVVPGNIMAADVIKLIKENGGSYTAKTVQGGELTFMLKGGKVILRDENGKTAVVTQADVRQSNGVIHVIDSVVTPKG